MGIFDRFPYSSTHEMNLDFMLGKATEIAEDMQTVATGMAQVQAGLSAISEKTEQATQAAAQAAASASSIEGSVTAAEEAAEEAQMHNESAQTWANNAMTYKADCQRSATEAAASSSSAAQAATAAAASEDTVATYAQAANASAQSAANNNDSAHQYANQASASASNATFHSSNAQTAATNAQTAATNANTSATNASASADRAASLKTDVETLHRMCVAAVDQAANSAVQAAASKTDVENLVESLPEDFTDLNNTVNQLSDDIGALLNLGDITLIPGFAVIKTSGKLYNASNYSYAEINVSVLVGSTFTGVSGASDDYGLAFYDTNGDYISGFGNPVAGTYNWSISGTVPDRAVLMRVSCRESHYSQFALHFNWNKTMVDIANGIAETQENTKHLEIVDKALTGIFIPKLRNGSAGNSFNADSVSTKYIYPIDFDTDYVEIEFLGDASLANEYAWGYCKYSGATDGMESSAAQADSSIGKVIFNGNADTNSFVPLYKIPVVDLIGYDHIMFFLFRSLDGVSIPIRIDTDQYNFRFAWKKNVSVPYIENDSEKTGHDLLYAKHAKGNTGERLTLVHFSDLHEDKNALARIMKGAEQYEYDDAICTGDIVRNTYAQIASWWNPAVMTCIGNHDTASYTAGVGYNWTALSMADRDAYYIAPFESNWNIVHTAGTSYYYKDYTTQHVRMIVMDAMLYTNEGTEATAQTAWLENMLADAITNDLHVLIAIHAPHGGATAEECSFSRYGQTAMPTYTDCNTPQTVIDTVATAISNGLHFIGYLVGHEHQDNIWDAENNGKQMMYCITCAAVSNVDQWKNSDQHRDINNDAYNLIVVDTANTLVKIIRGGGANIDDHMRTRKAICFNYSTGEKVGEIL